MTDTTSARASVRELPLEPGGELVIFLTSSDVRLRGVDAQSVTVRTREGSDLADELVVDAEPGRVHIRDAEQGYGVGPVRLRGRGAASLDIDVPRSARLTLKTLSGDVEASGIGPESQWSTASGDLRIAIEGGSLTADSMSGDLTVESAGPAGIRARSVSGDLRVRAPRIDALQVATTSGDIRIDADLGSEFAHTITAVSGDVYLQSDSPLRIESQSIAGDVRAAVTHRAEGSRGRRTIIVGDGSVRLSARTTSGDIRLKARDATHEEGTAVPAAPVAPVPPVAPVAPVAPVPPAAPVPPMAPGTLVAAADGVEPDGPSDATPAAIEDTSWVVAEAEAAPNLVRPAGRSRSAGDPEREAWSGAAGSTDRREAARLDILRALERGELDIEAASHRLEQLEDAGPRFFRGFC